MMESGGRETSPGRRGTPLSTAKIKRPALLENKKPWPCPRMSVTAKLRRTLKQGKVDEARSTSRPSSQTALLEKKE